MQRVIQAAGRVLRSSDDRGVILLLDDRFINERYVDLLPEVWRKDLQYDVLNWRESVGSFWNAGINNMDKARAG